MFLWFSMLVAAGEPIVLPGSSQEVVFDTTVSELVRDGLSALADGRDEEAARLFAALIDAGAGADAYYLRGVALYEAGLLRSATTVAAVGLAEDAEHAPLHCLRGLTLAEQGRGVEALQALTRAEELAADDTALLAHIEINRGLVHLDRGELTAARAKFERARQLATDAGDSSTAQLATSNLALAGAKNIAPSDILGRVSDAIRRGDLDKAGDALTAVPRDPREKTHHQLARAALLRAQGRLPDAERALHITLADAREAGLTRETAAALAELGSIYSLQNRPIVASNYLTEAITLVEGGSFRVNEVLYRVAAGRLSLRMGEVAAAETQRTHATRILPGIEDPVALAAVEELQGAIWSARNDAPAASRSFGAALVRLVDEGLWADAARVATDLVEANAGRNGDATERWSVEAMAHFERAGDLNGPAHVQIALGLGMIREKRLEEALAAFMGASEATSNVPTPRAPAIRQLAQDHATRVLVALGHSDEIARRSSELGLTGAVETQRSFARAETAYAEALTAYESGAFSEARAGFAEARAVFEELNELGYARICHRGWGWATYNLALGTTPAKGVVLLSALRSEVGELGDPELVVRTSVTHALLASRAEDKQAPKYLRSAADGAEAAGFPVLAGQCWAEVAVQESLQLEPRAEAARLAFSLLPRGDEPAVYAMYTVAVDAYNNGDYALAETLSEEVLPVAGSLADPVTAVLAATRAAQQP